MKILLLEDDDSREHLAGTLRSAGYVVEVADDGADAIALGTSGGHDILVLDRMVPNVDGLSVLRSLRASGVQAPAIFLTARGGIMDRVEGFEAGGDDYLVKPFATAELLARVSALGRRSRIAAIITNIVVGALKMDLISRTVTREGRKIELQQQEYKLLEFLMRHAGEVVTRTMLLEAVWDFHFDPGTNLIESHVSRLRAKIDKDFTRPMIQTVRGKGYLILP